MTMKQAFSSEDLININTETNKPIDPEKIRSQFNSCVQTYKAGRLSEAEAGFEHLLKFQPDNVEAWHRLGIIAIQQKQYSKALERIKHAIELAPKSHLLYNNLGIALKEEGKIEEAIESYQQSLKFQANNSEALINLGNLFKDVGKFDEAIKTYQKALEIKPNSSSTYNNLAISFKEQGKLDEAIESYQQALEISPDNVNFWNNLGNAFYQQGKLEKAFECYQSALDIKPDNARAKINLCMSQLPTIYSNAEEIKLRRKNYQKKLEELVKYYEKASESERANAANDIGSLQPFFLAYQGLNDRDLQKIYGELLCQLMSSRYPQWSKKLEIPKLKDNETIRIGFVSGFFQGHSNWKIPIKGWVENLDKDKFELFGYYTGSKKDSFTANAKKSFVKFVQEPFSIEKWCEVISQDNLHVLIYPEFGMNSTSLKLGCLRLAPIQMTSWGHPDTSGLPTIDYYLSSDLMEPENAQEYYTEKLVKLPNLSIHYTPLNIQPKALTKAEIGVKENEIMFWCCQSLYKYLPQHDDVFPRVSKELKNCKFVFIESHNSQNITKIFRDRLSNIFDQFGLNYQDYCIFLSRLTPKEFAGITSIADVFLDSIGWSGCNSTLEAITHNVPIMTLSGDLMRGRHSLGILKMIGIEETIASSKDEYINIAIRLGKDSHYRQYLSQKLADNKYKLYQDFKPIQALENFILRELNQLNMNQSTVPNKLNPIIRLENNNKQDLITLNKISLQNSALSAISPVSKTESFSDNLESFFALFKYRTTNVGDDIQTLAAMQFLPQVDLFIDRDNLSSINPAWKQKINMIMNGWFCWKHLGEGDNNGITDWPPVDNYNPLFVAFHLWNKTLLNDPATIEYFKSHEPIGCRDIPTVKALETKGIEAYFSGCLTLTLGYKENLSQPRQDGLVYFVDVPNDIAPYCREFINKKYGLKPRFITHSLRGVSFDILARLQLAQYYLSLYAQAQIVVTKRLHCALPCLALGTPVILIHNNPNDPRFNGYESLLYSLTKEDLQKRGLPIEEAMAFYEKRSISSLREQLATRVENWKCNLKNQDLRPNREKEEYYQNSNATHFDRYPKVFSYIKNYFSAQKIQQPILLSFGCSTGEECFSLQSYMPKAQILGMDIDEKNLKICHAKAKDTNIKFFHSNSENLEKNGLYDCIFAMSVLCRWPQTSQLSDISAIWPFRKFEQAVQKLDHVLKLGGLLVIYNSNFRFRDTKISYRYKHLLIEDLEESGFVHKFGQHNRKLLGYQDNEIVFQKLK